jgi:hypothetical protein
VNPTISIEGDNFALTFPGVESEGSHTTLVPIGATEILIRVLTAWKEAQPHERKIGFAASPTQHMVEKWLTSHEAKVDVRVERARLAARAAEVQEKYGINLEEIEL